jgi:hypothetical protein
VSNTFLQILSKNFILTFFLFDLRSELEDRKNQYKVLPPLFKKIVFLNTHFSCSGFIYWIPCCCRRTNRGKQQSKHLSRRFNMGSEICYNLHNYLPRWKRCIFTPITVQIFNILIIWPPYVTHRSLDRRHTTYIRTQSLCTLH